MNDDQHERIERAEHDLDTAETDDARYFYSCILHYLKLSFKWGESTCQKS